jgi:hypothetical protein
VSASAAPPTAAGGRPAWLLGALVAWLALLPLLQAASLAGLRIGNAAPDRPWNYVAYGLAAPYVAWLVWRRHPRARFATYVFLTHEAARGLHGHRWDAVLVAVLWVLVLQLPPARRSLPAIRPAEVRARWRPGRARRSAPPPPGDRDGGAAPSAP